MKHKLLLLSICLFITKLVFAALPNITIVGGKNFTTLAIVGFNNDNIGVTKIINNDLSLLKANYKVITVDNLDKAMLDKNNNYLLTGMIIGNKISYTLLFNNKNGEIRASGHVVYTNNLRLAAHEISDAIYKAITNNDGIFTTHIAYVLYTKNHNYDLIISDYDGYNPTTIITSKEPIVSVSFNARGDKIAYTTFIQSHAVIYVQNIYDATKNIIADYIGSNSSPTFIDDKHLAVTLNLNSDQSQIYLINNTPFKDLKSNPPKQLFNFATINTEAYAVGNSMVFTSNKDGKPQIFYTANFNDNKVNPTNLTLGIGTYSLSAKLSLDKKNVTFINHSADGLSTYVLNLQTDVASLISSNHNDSAPSFSGNGDFVLMVDDKRFLKIASIADIGGKNLFTVHLLQNDYNKIIDAVWSAS